MTIGRRAAWYLVGFALWNVYVWATFVANVYPQHHLDRFFLLHALVGGVTVALAVGAGAIGVRALRAHRRARRAASGSRSPTAEAGPGHGVTGAGRGD